MPISLKSFVRTLPITAALFAVIIMMLPHPEGPQSLPPTLEVWHSKGVFVPVHGGAHKVWAARFPADPDVEPRLPMLLVHGFPTSSYDFSESIPFLTRAGHDAVVVDLLGFGNSNKPLGDAYSYSLFEQADTVLEAWHAISRRSGRFHVVCHDMGDTICEELIARDLRGVLAANGTRGAPLFASVTFNNGGMIIEMANFRITQTLLRLPWIGRQLAKLSSFALFDHQIRSIMSPAVLAAQPQRMAKEIEHMWDGIQWQNGRRVMPDTIGYISERQRWGRTRWLASAAAYAKSVPTMILWGADDTVAPLAMGQAVARAIPDAEWRVLEHTGHFPMVERPEQWAAEIMSFIHDLE